MNRQIIIQFSNDKKKCNGHILNEMQNGTGEHILLFFHFYTVYECKN